jgi:1,4-dihydroxy-6-naphthoate synthase
VSLSLAISPCPNDTFTFDALVHGRVDGAPAIEVTYADVDVTNTAALDGAFDLVKVSYAALPWLLGTYELLPCGGALGRGCGPLLLVRDESVAPQAATTGGESTTPRAGTTGDESATPQAATTGGESVLPQAGLTGDASRASLAGKTVAVPGDRTTAYLLLRLWAAGVPFAKIEIVPFHEIMPGVAAGTYDAGLVIHEARFTYPRYGLTALVDLGEWWERDTGLPIPLGAILAHRERVHADAATEWVRDSVRQAWADPAASEPYVLEHAQEMESDVVAQHIGLYVNGFTEALGDEGYAAIRTLLNRAAAEGLVPPVPESALTPSISSRP